MSACVNPCHRCGPTCTCPHGPASLGILYGVNMGIDPNTRLRDDPACPVHAVDAIRERRTRGKAH